MKFVVVANNPLPYHTPILNALADRVDLHVIYMSSHHPLGSFRDPWGADPRFSYSFHPGARLGIPRFDLRLQVSLGVSRAISRHRPDALLVSSWGPLTWEPLAWARAHQCAGLIWAESTSWSGLFRGRLSEALRRRVVGTASGFVANGTAARNYVIELGAPSERVVTSCLPSAIFSPRHPSPARSGPPRFLFVGRLIASKQPVELIGAFRRVLDQVPDATLTIVGAGAEGERAELAARSLGASVRFTGHLEGDALVKEYDEADILVLAAFREVWGLVINEAITRGLFIIASDQVGAALDLVHGKIGRVVAAGDSQGLEAALVESAAAIAAIRAHRSERAKATQCCTPSSFAAAIVQAAEIGALR